LQQKACDDALFEISGVEEGEISHNSLFFSLLAGNLGIETGSIPTACATTKAL
jgi:hypothetical protein